MNHATSASRAPATSHLAQDPGWWIFCLLILALKLLMLAIDPSPKMFMGDSGSYLWTALSGWIPPDRSFLYGFVVRWTALYSGSLTSLLLLQTGLSALTAILVAFICRKLFHLRSGWGYLFGILCALDPLQVVWERYLMTETISLALYALMLASAFYYLKERRLWQLGIIQLLGVLLISFRISYLLVVEASTVVLPILAFWPGFWSALRQKSDRSTRSSTAKPAAVHLAVSVVLMFGLHLAYKEVNGLLAHRRPAYLYSSGLSILATWAPALKPSDSPDPRLAAIIAQGNQFHISDLGLRNSQLYSPGYLVSRWKETEPDLGVADRAAKQAALHTLLRRPADIFALGMRTFLAYFDTHQLYRQAKSDLGKADWPKTMTAKLADHLRLAPPGRAERKSFSLLQKYFLRSEPYYYVVLFAPLVSGALLIFLRDASVVLLVLHSGIFLATDSLLAVTASVRYLQPLSLLTLLSTSLIVKTILEYRVSRRQVT